MSKIFTRSNRLPLIVEKKLAEKINEDFIHKTTPPETILPINHSTGKTTIVFGDITRVDVTNNDNDYNISWRENNDKVYTPVKEFEAPTEEDKASFVEKSKLLKQMMGWK